MFSSTESVLRDKLSVLLKVPSSLPGPCEGTGGGGRGLLFRIRHTSTHFSPTHWMKYVAQGFAESQTNPTETCKQKRVQWGLWREVRGTPSLAAPPGPPHPWCAAGREDLDPCRVDIGERQEASSEHRGLFCTKGGGPARVQSVFFSSSSLGSGMAGMGGCPFRTSMCWSGASSNRSLPSMSLARS